MVIFSHSTSDNTIVRFAHLHHSICSSLASSVSGFRPVPNRHSLPIENEVSRDHSDHLDSPHHPHSTRPSLPLTPACRLRSSYPGLFVVSSDSDPRVTLTNVYLHL